MKTKGRDLLQRAPGRRAGRGAEAGGGEIERWEESSYGVKYTIEYALRRGGEWPVVTLRLIAQYPDFEHILEVRRAVELKKDDGTLWYYTHFTASHIYSVGASRREIRKRVEVERLTQEYDWPFRRHLLEERIKEVGVRKTMAEIIDYVKELAGFDFPL